MKTLIVCVLVLIVIQTAWTLSSNSCPVASRLASCSPKCTDSSNCRGGQVCCTNICNTKSCVDINQYLSDNKSGSNGSAKTGATGTYCGNVKCTPGEKCELDRTTKRQKCVRA